MFRLYKARLIAHPATCALLTINILVYFYICMQVNEPFFNIFFAGPGYNTLLLYGAKENSLIALGQVYRIFLPMFIHANFVHLTVNMLGLWSVGRIFEGIAGSKKLFILYLIAGITGNLCSFAILPNLSVGASGSLFGILLCLYVIQKYQEKINKHHKNKEPPLALGNIILINGALNIVFGLTFPIFDWACHLGGSIAGILYGFALVTKQSWKLRIFAYTVNHINTFNLQKIPKKRFLERHIIYYFGIVLINICFSMSAKNIQSYNKIAGLGSYAAAQNTTPPMNYKDLSQYKDLLIVINKETNPNNLLYGALLLGQKNYYFASYKLFFLLNELEKYNFMDTSLTPEEYKSLIESGLNSTQQHIPFTKEILNLNLKSTLQYENLEDYCAKPANLFMTLGFFEISGNLYECAYSLNGKNNSYALKAFESFRKIENERGMAQVLSLVKSFSE